MKANVRGKELAIELAINIFGVVAAHWVDYGLSYVGSQVQLRFSLALQILFARITLAGILVLPESPRWLIAHDRHDEAKHILWALEMDVQRLDPNDSRLVRELSKIKHAVDEERAAASHGSYRAMLQNGSQKFLYRTMLGIGGRFMQQLSGINLITYYAPVIFEQCVSMPHHLSLLFGGVNGVVFFVSSLVPIWIIDRLGRRKLMPFAAAGQACPTAALAARVTTGQEVPGIAAMVMISLFGFFFAVGLLAIPWLLPAEYAPLALRTRAAALGSASNCKPFYNPLCCLSIAKVV